MVFPQFTELWKLVDLLVRKDFRQANLVYLIYVPLLGIFKPIKKTNSLSVIVETL